MKLYFTETTTTNMPKYLYSLVCLPAHIRIGHIRWIHHFVSWSLSAKKAKLKSILMELKKWVKKHFICTLYLTKMGYRFIPSAEIDSRIFTTFWATTSWILLWIMIWNWFQLYFEKWAFDRKPLFRFLHTTYIFMQWTSLISMTLLAILIEVIKTILFRFQS